MRVGRLIGVIGILLTLLATQWLVTVGPATATANIDPRCVAYGPSLPPEGIDCDQVMPGTQVDYIKIFYPHCFIKLTGVGIASKPAGMTGIVDSSSTCAIFPVGAPVLVTLAPLQVLVIRRDSRPDELAPLRCVAYPPYPDGIDCDQVMPGTQVDYIKIFYPGCFIKLTGVGIATNPAGMIGIVDGASTCPDYPEGAVVLVSFGPLQVDLVKVGSEPVEPTPIEPTPTVAAAAVVQ